MEKLDYHRDDGEYVIRTELTGSDLLNHPLMNKGTAFTPPERERFKLKGLLPATVKTMDQQADRIHASIQRKQDALEKYIGLAGLQDRNEHLFYRVLTDNFEELLPIVYTPTVGLACQQYSKLFRRGRGLWISPLHRGYMAEVLRNARFSGIKLIVVTDNEAILGIGDQGAGGMAISVGKLALYCAGAGIHPAETLPISLDVGTNNQELLANDAYLGVSEPRLTGQDYDDFIAEFVDAVREVFPEALVQWEDFKKNNALSILERYRHNILSFNDDIQGTGAVALAGIMSGCRIKQEKLIDQRIVVFGAGAAGMGIARQLQAAMMQEGLSKEDAAGRLALIDSRGLLVDDRDIGDSYKQALAWPAAHAESVGLGAGKQRDLGSVVEAWQPTVLIGSSGQGGAFNESLVRAMAARCKRPMIFPFSNPTDCCEALPTNLLRWSEGRCMIATGSPFDPVHHEGRTVKIGQGNNVFIFPGLGLGALLSGASEVTDNMITASARSLAAQVRNDELDSGLLYPGVSRLREVTVPITVAVIEQAREDGVATAELPDGDALEQLVRDGMWTPEYPTLVSPDGD